MREERSWDGWESDREMLCQGCGRGVHPMQLTLWEEQAGLW
jgi:hypothetical protein